MLGDRHAAGRYDQGSQRRDIPGAGLIAARADHVDRVFGRLDPQHAGPHGLDGSGDFIDGLAANPQPHEEGAGLGMGDLAGKQKIESALGLERRQRLSGRHLGEDRFERVHGDQPPTAQSSRPAGLLVDLAVSSKPSRQWFPVSRRPFAQSVKASGISRMASIGPP